MKVVIADDDVTTRALLVGLLSKWGFDTVAAKNGEDAWRNLKLEVNPCVALLDWLMPGMSGIDVCRKLGQRPHGPFVYAILLTSKGGQDDKIHGLTAGAHAFITKPFDPDELQTCLRVAQRVLEYEAELRIKNQRLQGYAERMEQFAEARAQQLVHADRMATLGLLSAGVAHEINNPATFIAGNVQDLETAWDLVGPRVRQDPSDTGKEADQLAFVLREVPKMLAGIREGVERIARITDGLKGYARRGHETEAPFSINECINKSLELCHNSLKHSVKVKTKLGDNMPDVLGAAQEVEQVFVNLFINAAQAMKGRGGASLRICTQQVDSTIRIEIEDSGPGFSKNALEQIFNPFFTTKKQGEGTGLGLSISEGIIEAHRGTILASNASAGGARFVITVPTHLEGDSSTRKYSDNELREGHETTIIDCR